MSESAEPNCGLRLGIAMKPATPKLLTRRCAVMLAAAISTFAVVDRAAADCTPPSSASNATVECTGLTKNSVGPFFVTGYGNFNDSRVSQTLHQPPTIGCSVVWTTAAVAFVQAANRRRV
jgi:hypothetical protein